MSIHKDANARANTDIDALRAVRPALALVLALVLALALGPIGIGGAGPAASNGLARQASARLAPALAHRAVRAVANTAPAALYDAGTAELLDKVGPALVDIATDTSDGGTGAGTGIVVTERGLVLTVAHVVVHAVGLRATDVGDGRTYRASVVGVDIEHDIALIQLSGAGGLRTATLGDSDSVSVGDYVASIGNADGLGLTVGAGPVVHLDREIASTADPDPAADPLSGLIEARSWVRPGESGGPMVSYSGEVVGVNVAYSVGRDGAIQPVGYAIPINQAIDTAHELLAKYTR